MTTPALRIHDGTTSRTVTGRAAELLRAILDYEEEINGLPLTRGVVELHFGSRNVGVKMHAELERRSAVR